MGWVSGVDNGSALVFTVTLAKTGTLIGVSFEMVTNRDLMNKTSELVVFQGIANF